MILQWRALALSEMGSLTVKGRSGRPGVAVFTDAATSAAIIAAVTIIRDEFGDSESILEVRFFATGKYWDSLSGPASVIYGLWTLDLLAALYRPDDLLAGENVTFQNATFRIYNGNAFEAVVKNNDIPIAIAVMAQLIWHRISALGITAWFEWVPGARKAADLPTRNSLSPFGV